GYALPPIIGVQLDGSPGFAEIPDTDGGELDGDPEFDRAVGPMQFIPESWRKYGRDANGDGRADPNQIDDAAVASARLLCETGGDLSQAENWQRAVLAYNASQEYVMSVRDAAAAYSVRTTAPWRRPRPCPPLRRRLRPRPPPPPCPRRFLHRPPRPCSPHPAAAGGCCRSHRCNVDFSGNRLRLRESPGRAGSDHRVACPSGTS